MSEAAQAAAPPIDSGGPFQRLREYSRPLPPPLPARSRARLLFGVARPLSALRLLAQERDLLSAALVPVLWLAAFCGAAALLRSEEGREQVGLLRSFYRTFVVLAPVPSILFANHYSLLAARAHERLGLGTCRARREPLLRAASHALRQLVVVALALAPLLFALGRVPALGQALVKALGALWALHWIVVEALDGARVLPPAAEVPPPPPRPWFVRLLDGVARRLPGVLAWPVARFADFCSWLCRPWHEEIALCQRHPWLLLGFAITTAALLATPALNLCFRPIIIVAAVGLLGELRRSEGAEGAQ